MRRGSNREGFALQVHIAAREIREALGWQSARMARELGLSRHLWSKYELGSVQFTQVILERFRLATGIDPYVLAYISRWDHSQLPEDVRELLVKLQQTWTAQLERAKQCRQGLLAP